MTDLSDREHDAFDNPAKMACRAGNLRVLREAQRLYRHPWGIRGLSRRRE
jgi:hypothetical protein